MVMDVIWRRGVRSILLLSLVARCLETIMYVYGACLFYVCCSDWVGVCGNVVMDSVFSLGMLKYVVCLCKGCDGCCVFCLYCLYNLVHEYFEYLIQAFPAHSPVHRTSPVQ